MKEDKGHFSVRRYIDDMYDYLYTHDNKINLEGEVYRVGFLSEVFDYLFEHDAKAHDFIEEWALYDVSDRPLAAAIVMFIKKPELGFKDITKKAIEAVKEEHNLEKIKAEKEYRDKIQAKLDRINKQRAGTLKGFKTATYGEKSHRDNIAQLENSVRRMF